MSEPRLKGSQLLDSVQQRHVLWGLVVKTLPAQGALPFRTIEIIVEMLIKSVEFRDPRLAREWTYEKNTIIAMLAELDYRGTVKFERPKVNDVIDYDAATVGTTKKTLLFLAGMSKEVKDVMSQVPRTILDLLAIAALDPP